MSFEQTLLDHVDSPEFRMPKRALWRVRFMWDALCDNIGLVGGVAILISMILASSIVAQNKIWPHDDFRNAILSILK